MKMDKEYLYVGHYIDIFGNYILKIGTTNNLDRRAKEHTRNYKKSPNATMPPESAFVYDWFTKLSKYNTLRYEDSNKKEWREQAFGDYIRNDRFVCAKKPERVFVKIRKIYEITLGI